MLLFFLEILDQMLASNFCFILVDERWWQDNFEMSLIETKIWQYQYMGILSMMRNESDMNVHRLTSSDRILRKLQMIRI